MSTKSIPADGAAASDGYVVGIGASAGGLEAINQFFDNVPPSTGYSFVVIQHLSPDYKSLMSELLAKHTDMRVIEAGDQMPVEPNCIYLIPTKKILTIKNGKLLLKEKQKDNHPNTTIDSFLESLAIEKKDKAVAIILSGTGSDGTKGIEAIKQNGGTVIIQDPSTAEFDGMPNNAIATGCGDIIAAPETMGEEMLEFVKEAPLIRAFNALNNHEEAIIADILELILKVTQHDFRHYKRPTLNRRLAKRMAERNIKALADYYAYLVNNPEEIKGLCREFLINVTRFFRDEDAFDCVKKEVIPALFANKDASETLKIWVVASSTGEEAYSLAMMFEEYIESNRRFDVNVKIFATDIDQQAIEIASKGLYSEEAVKGTSPERLKRFFTKEGTHYKVSPTIRKMVVFAKHDITKDPPFSRIDLLTCRNMLIYMNPVLQKNILLKFHFALNEDGFIFLGPSENIGILKDVTREVEKKWKIFRCISKHKTGEYEAFINPVDKPRLLVPNVKSKNALNHLAEIFKDTLLEEYAYAGILIDKEMEVKQATGNFKNFISFPEANFNFNLLKLVPPDLSIALSTCIRKAIKDNEKVVQRKVKVQRDKTERSITIIVKPYLNQRTYLQPFLFVVLSEEIVEEKTVPVTLIQGDHLVGERIFELENELKDTKENLQAVIEEVESANEELQSTNEEIISANEELQSTNEELQSLNEELHTVNAEHQLKIKELIELNDDLNNYFNNSEIGQILLDKNLNIRKFTPIATRQVNLIEGDIGRPIKDISTNFTDSSFINEIKKVIQTGKKVEKEIVMDEDNIYLMKIAPYLRQDKSLDGVVVNFIDVTQLKTLNSILEAVLDSSTSGILAKRAIRDNSGKIIDFEYTTVNRIAEVMFSMQTGTIKGKKMKSLFDLENDAFYKYVEVVETNKTCQFETFYTSTGRWYEVVGVKMMDGLVTTVTDVTDRKVAADMIAKGYEELKKTSNKLELTNVQLERSNFDLLQFASVASHDLKEPLRKIQAYGNLLKSKVHEKLEDGEAGYLEKVISASNRMQVLVEDILTLSKLSNTEIPTQPTNLNEIVTKITDDLEILVQEKNADIRFKDLPTINAVPGQMHQLFQNLISNGLKFNNKERPLIIIQQVPVSKELKLMYNINNSDYVCIEVIDDGIGFEQQYAEKIFGIFQRLEGNSYQGSGIGLAICKKIVEKHNGFIKAESEPGNGAKFIILLSRE